jgi:flagellar basal-body rod protein FlgB
MFLKAVETSTGRSLERAMDVAALRAEVLSQNIANVNTPHYKRRDVDFPAVLAETVARDQKPLARTDPRHFAFGGETSLAPLPPRVVVQSGTTERFDGNNIDVEFEMAQVAENSMYYQSLAAMWKKEMSKIKMAIEGRS